MHEGEKYMKINAVNEKQSKLLKKKSNEKQSKLQIKINAAYENQSFK